MIEFPTPAHIRRLTCEQFCQVAWDLVGRKVDKAGTLREIWELAQDSAALPHAPDSLAVETSRLTLRHFQTLTTLRGEIEIQAERTLSCNEDYERLKSHPGIGPIVALTILAEAGNLRRYGHHRKFLKYCGFDLAKYQSGSHRGQEQLSKRGNSRLRLAFWIAGAVAIRLRENSFKDKYDRYIKADPDNADLCRKALTAVAAKMARVAYGMIKANQPYRRFAEQSLPSGMTPP